MDKERSIENSLHPCYVLLSRFASHIALAGGRSVRAKCFIIDRGGSRCLVRLKQTQMTSARL